MSRYSINQASSFTSEPFSIYDHETETSLPMRYGSREQAERTIADLIDLDRKAMALLLRIANAAGRERENSTEHTTRDVPTALIDEARELFGLPPLVTVGGRR